MNKNNDLTENLYNACKNWLENFERPLDEWKKTCHVIFFVDIYN